MNDANNNNNSSELRNDADINFAVFKWKNL